MRTKQLRQGVLIGVLVVVALWLMSLTWGLAGKARIAIKQERETKHQYDVLEVRKSTLAANLAEFDTPRGKDAAIRTAFGVAKVGEEVIVVVSPSQTVATSTPPWWRRVLNWF